MRNNSWTLGCTSHLGFSFGYRSPQQSLFIVLPFLLAIFLIGTVNAQAANRYVRAGASGSATGTDWTNAYTTLPSTLVRGDTYYIASGSYGGYTFDDAASGTTLIIVKKATVADHGTDTGWSDSYASGQAVWTSWDLNSSYLTIDGQTGGGPGAWDTGLGFAVRAQASHLLTGGATTNVTVLHTELDGVTNVNGDRDALYFLSSTTNLTFRYIYMHDIGCDFAQIRSNQTGFTFEYSKAYRNNQDAACHGDVFEYDGGTALNWVIRYNWFDECQGTYLLGSHSSGTLDNAQFYGNIVSGGFMDNGLVSGLSSGGTITNLQFYNNTIANLGGINAGFQYLNRGTNNLIYNNIFYFTSSTAVNMEGTHDYNWFFNAGSQNEAHIQIGSGNPFVNFASKNFNLISATNVGKSLSTLFQQDMNGQTRGLDGTWDRGALEMIGGTSLRPAAPTGLSVQ